MWRFVRASALFAGILLSYLFLWLASRVVGRRRVGPALARAHARHSRRLRWGFLRLQGVYIKIGQVLSILGSFLPPEYIAALQGLQDQVPPRPYRTIRRTFLADRGRPPEAFFAEMEEAPIAAASLGQVHRARLPSGEQVAVKVLYPNIDRIIAIDMRVLGWVFRVYRMLFPIADVRVILDQLRDVLQRETDYVQEADNCERLAAAFADDPRVTCPRVFRDLSSGRILVMELMEGIKLTDLDGLRAAGICPTEVATLLVRSYYKQLLLDGLYHADPHPGNFLVRPGPQLVFLDFGAVEPVRPPLREGMRQCVFGYMRRDDAQVLAGIETMGFVAPDGNRALLEETVRHYFTKIVTMKIEDYGALDVRDFVGEAELRMVRGRLRELMRAVRFPEGWFFIERSLLLLFGVCAVLDPKVNAVELGFPYAMQFLATPARKDPPGQ